MNTSQFQELQKMQRIQQQMQAQLRQQQQQQQQQQHGGLQSQQTQLSAGGGSFGNLTQGMAQMQQSSQLSNQQWMDQAQQSSQRGSFSAINPAMMMQQQSNQSGMGASSNSSQNVLLWNALQGKGSGSSSMDASGSTSSTLAALGGIGLGGSASTLGGMMDTSQMQAFLQQQSMGGNQASQLRGMGSQQHLGGISGDLSGPVGMLSQQQLSQLQKMGGSSSSLLSGSDSQSQMSAGNTSAQLLLQQQSMIADLKRRLHAQSGVSGSGGGNSLVSSDNPGSDRRSSSSSTTFQQQQAQLLELQRRSSSNSALIQQALAGGMMQDSSSRGNATPSSVLLASQAASGGANQQQQRNSLGSAEPISLASLMTQGGQNSLGMGQLGRRDSDSQSNSLLGIFDSSNGGGASMLMQQAQLHQMAQSGNMDIFGGNSGRSSLSEQILAQQQLLAASRTTNDMSNVQQLLMGQGTQRIPSDDLISGINESDAFDDSFTGRVSSAGTEGGDEDGTAEGKGNKATGDGSGKVRRRSSSSRNKKTQSDERPSPQAAPGNVQSSGQSFLDGTFNGGWQSNDDIPDRRRVIYSICKVIEQMRPDASKMSERLPFMAKRLEEHLYRSAQTKEEYLDPATLKKRLQMIAHGLEVHRTSSTGTKNDAFNTNEQGESSTSMGAVDSAVASSLEFLGGNDTSAQQQKLQEQIRQLQQLQQLQQLYLQYQQIGASPLQLEAIVKQQQELKDNILRANSKRMSGQQSSTSSDFLTGSGDGALGSSGGTSLSAMAQLQQGMLPHQSITTMSSSSVGISTQGILKTSDSKYHDPQKRKVVKQQQQRLLLLRHASKCKAGDTCKVKFCGQMVALWKHMKKCRDKNCKTAHCLSSRCVLNHYRICKSENKTATCEVCGPVMRQIKLQNAQIDDDDDSLTQDKNNSVPQRDPSQQELQESPQGFSHGSTDFMRFSGSEDGASLEKHHQIEELHTARLKLQQQHVLLKQLQNQQAQLLQQQKQLREQQQHVLPQTQQGQQLQQQQLLLQQLQQQFQQQQVLLQQELLRQSQVLKSSSNEMQGQNQALDGVGNVDVLAGETARPQSAKSRRRTSTTRRGGKSKSHDSGDTAMRRGSIGKGKRLSNLETHIAKEHDSHKNAAAIDADVSNQFEDEGSNKRLGDEILSNDGREPLEGRQQAVVSDNPEDVSSRQKSERVLEQGDADHTTSLIPSMSKEDIEDHLGSLECTIKLSPRAIAQKCLPVLRRLIDDQFGWVFRDAVDPDVLGLPDYFEVVKNPMYLSLIEQKLENSVYKDINAVQRDIKLVFENAILYNGPDSEVGEMAQIMIDRFEADFQEILKGLKHTRERLMENGDICSLCNSQRRLFEPTVLYCSGACDMQKIRRNAYYYTAGATNQWCVNCFGLLTDDEPLMLDDGTEVHKTDLRKVKNDANPEEAWVQCDTCDSWVHQICALFNGRKNKSAKSYICPKCHLGRLISGETKVPEERMKGAKDLPHTKMSFAIEKGLENHLRQAYEQQAGDLGVALEEVEKAHGLTVRVISNIEKNHMVMDEMYNRYSKTGCPSEFPVRSKCIALFQKVHGVDVLLFGMYVFEYGHDCPAPNRRRVYISYLDSAQYFEPKCYRTTVYHALMVEYLRYVKNRGFHTAHIWSCPPTPGDDYIFHCHPSRQLIPRDDMLRDWYLRMLEKAKKEGIVLDVRTLHDEYFKNNGSESTTGRAFYPTCLPYFEGDYIPGEIENIIKDLNSEDEAKSKIREDMPSLSTNNKGGSKLGTRSNPGELVSVGQDKVMLRLGLAMTNMQENFMVAHLRSRSFAAAVENGEDVSGWTEEDDATATPNNKRPKIGGKNGGAHFSHMDGQKAVSAVDDPDGESQVKDVAEVKEQINQDETKAVQILESSQERDEVNDADKDDQKKPEEEETNSVASVEVSVQDGSTKRSDDDPMNSFKDDSAHADSEEDNVDLSQDKAFETDPEAGHDPPSRVRGDERDGDESREREGKLTDMLESAAIDSSSKTGGNVKVSDESTRKRGFDEIEPAISRFAAANVDCSPIGDTIDEDEPQEVEMFESRQQILNYCQTNHFQFDELRRAKHTTMMLLFQLHNPHAPKFIPTCGACTTEITHGTRYHCNDCNSYDLCENCYESVITGKWAERGSKYTHDGDHTFAAIDAEADLDVQKSREERSRALKTHLELLAHAAACEGPPTCSLNNCARMKQLFEHVRMCKVTPKKSCKFCSRILTLLTVHARICRVRNASCPLPYCDRIREKMQRRRQQQQLMDDRRRQAQNQLYRVDPHQQH